MTLHLQSSLEIEAELAKPRKSTIGVIADNEAQRAKCINITQYICLAIIISIYLGYVSSQYFDTDENRKSYTIDKTVSSMPIPYIYVDWSKTSFSNGTGGVDTCAGVFEITNDDDSTVMNLTSFEDYTYYDDDTSMSTILDDYTQDEFQMIYFPVQLSGGDIYHQVLIIPSNTDSTFGTLSVDGKATATFSVQCELENVTYVDMYMSIDSKEQLRKFDTIGSAMDDLFGSSEYIYEEHEISVSYQWFAYDNRIDDVSNDYDYFITTIGSTFDLSGDNYLNAKTIISMQPNSVGKKTIFVTTKDMEILDIFSQTGGIYSIVRDIAALIVAFFLWGDLISIRIFKGCAPNTNPDSIEERLSNQINNEFEAMNDKIALLQKQIRKLKDANNKHKTANDENNKHIENNNENNTLNNETD